MFGRNLFGEVIGFALIAAIYTAILMYLPAISEGDYWGKFLNTFIVCVVFYLSVRWAYSIRGRILK